MQRNILYLMKNAASVGRGGWGGTKDFGILNVLHEHDFTFLLTRETNVLGRCLYGNSLIRELNKRAHSL